MKTKECQQLTGWILQPCVCVCVLRCGLQAALQTTLMMTDGEVRSWFLCKSLPVSPRHGLIEYLNVPTTFILIARLGVPQKDEVNRQKHTQGNKYYSLKCMIQLYLFCGWKWAGCLEYMTYSERSRLTINDTRFVRKRIKNGMTVHFTVQLFRSRYNMTLFTICAQWVVSDEPNRPNLAESRSTLGKTELVCDGLKLRFTSSYNKHNNSFHLLELEVVLWGKCFQFIYSLAPAFISGWFCFPFFMWVRINWLDFGGRRLRTRSL